jgi:hypothetical protein
MEIRYQIAEASEDYLVWGINGWALLPGTTRPAGTIVKGGLMYTPGQLESICRKVHGVRKGAFYAGV